MFIDDNPTSNKIILEYLSENGNEEINFFIKGIDASKKEGIAVKWDSLWIIKKYGLIFDFMILLKMRIVFWVRAEF